MTTPSPESALLADLFTQISTAFPTDGNTYLQRAIYDQISTAATECPTVTYTTTTIPTPSSTPTSPTRPALWCHPSTASPSHCLLYFHGGGFSFGSLQSHRKLFAHLAHACGTVGLMIDYRLTPEHHYPDPLNDCVDAYAYLLGRGFEAGRIVVAGDSAGGGLAVTVPLAAVRGRGLEGPGAAVALSPLFDLTVSGESFGYNEGRDCINSREFVGELGRRYTDGGKAVGWKDELVSPIFAETLRGLGSTWVSVAGFDMLRSDGERFAEKARKDGVDVVIEVHEGMQHVMEFMVGRAPEADGSVKRIGEWVRGKIGS